MKKKQREQDGKVISYYEYEEAKLTREEWAAYQKELDYLEIRQQRADIDYIALMMGVDLDLEEPGNEQDV